MCTYNLDYGLYQKEIQNLKLNMSIKYLILPFTFILSVTVTPSKLKLPPNILHFALAKIRKCRLY